MQFLANENFPLTSVNRVILTFDRDYGELIYRLRMPSPRGIIYFRYQPLTPEEPAEHLLQLLNEKSTSFSGQFTVLEREQLRQRFLP